MWLEAAALSAVRSIYDARIMGDGAGSVVSGDMDERRSGSVVRGDKELLFAGSRQRCQR